MTLSFVAQRQAVGRAIEVQKRLVSGATVKAKADRSNEQLQLDHLLEVERSLVWMMKNREAVVALEVQLALAATEAAKASK